ncbi:hypothetical protein KO566_02895 [Flavobacteriaceae bacterium XHP0103]|uniref:hypothetical protein n=1 Tax=Marixanthotalea marina TaxID=2844359 RepID=UPI002989FEF2|nr:hypothetical protein [Marixanthotalea marina]MBU3820995.1 hypothetical protein [Marixanthotalea marina]
MYSLFDKFLSNTLSSKEEEALSLLLENIKNKKAFEVYLKDQKDINGALQEPDLREAYKKIKGFSKKHKGQTVRLLNINWFKFVAVLFISLSMSNGVFTELDNAFPSVYIEGKTLNQLQETFKTIYAF